MPIAAMSQTRQDTKEYLNQRGYLNRTFPGAKKGGMKGEVKRGEVVRECTRPEGERGGGKWGKRVGGERRGARKGTRKTLILVPLWFRYSLVTFQQTRQSNAALRLKGVMEVAGDLRFWAAISEPETPSFCGEFWRFRSVNGEIASDCDCAILVR